MRNDQQPQRTGESVIDGPSAPPVGTVTVVNPLGGALRHYTDALSEAVAASGATVLRHDAVEPSVSGNSRARWLWRYVALLRRARSDGSALTIVTWPALGYLDLVLIRAVLGRTGVTALVVHDPDPLVPSVGLGLVGRAIARHLPSSTRFITHGEEALSALRRHGLADRASLVPHPVRRRTTPPGPQRTSPRPVVRVLGSWKPDRDVEVLGALGTLLADCADLEIHGRGWPSVEGWTVSDRFVSEHEFDELVRTASVILVPYRRVFQSGIAVRALELGTPFVGPRVSAHRTLYPTLPELLVDQDLDPSSRTSAWLTAVKTAISLPDSLLQEAAETAADAAAEGWTTLVAGARG